MKKSYNKAFTLVELLAVIVILAIILVIAVPKIMDVINSSKKSTLETSVKMIASTAEKTKMQNTVLGKEDEEITCDSVAKLSSSDYESCKIKFDGNTAKVTVKGKGKFEGLSLCGGTKNEATAISSEEGCPTDGMFFTYEKAIEVEDISKCGVYLFQYNFNDEYCWAICNGTYEAETISALVSNGYIAASDFEEAGLKLSDTYIVINGYNIEGGLDVIIPSTIDGYAVSEIGQKSFYNIENNEGLGIKSVVIPNSVTSIGGWAFLDNPLSKVELANPNIGIGRCAFGLKEEIEEHNLPDTYECKYE